MTSPVLVSCHFDETTNLTRITWKHFDKGWQYFTTHHAGYHRSAPIKPFSSFTVNQ